MKIHKVRNQEEGEFRVREERKMWDKFTAEEAATAFGRVLADLGPNGIVPYFKQLGIECREIAPTSA